jgi:hypothetical protein
MWIAFSSDWGAPPKTEPHPMPTFRISIGKSAAGGEKTVPASSFGTKQGQTV